MFRGQFIVVNSYLKKEERSQANNNLHLKTLGKKEQTKPRGRKEIIKTGNP